MNDVTDEMIRLQKHRERRAYLGGVMFALWLFANSLWWKHVPEWLAWVGILSVLVLAFSAAWLFIQAYRCQVCGSGLDLDACTCSGCGRVFARIEENQRADA